MIKLKINFFLLLISFLIFFSCGKNKLNNSSSDSFDNRLANLNSKKKLLLKKIKMKTIKDLKKIGIEKMLLNKNGQWWALPGIRYDFKKNGKAYEYDKGRLTGFFYWKVENGKLYINPNKVINRLRRDVNKYYKILIKTTEPTVYSNIKGLIKIKYVLVLESQDENIGIIMNFIITK